MNIDASLEASAQLTQGAQPGVRALDHPAVVPEPIIALGASAGDTILDAPALEVSTASCKVVALVCMQFLGPPARPAPLATDGRQGVDQLLEDHRVMPVGTGDAKDQRDALAVRGEVALAAEFAPVRGIGPRVRAPGGWARWPRPYSLGSGRACRRRAVRTAASDTGHATRLRPASREAVSSRSCRSHAQVLGEALPRQCPCAARTGCR